MQNVSKHWVLTMQVLILEHYPHLYTLQHSSHQHCPLLEGLFSITTTARTYLNEYKLFKRRKHSDHPTFCDNENFMLNFVYKKSSKKKKANVMCKVHALVKRNLLFWFTLYTSEQLNRSQYEPNVSTVKSLSSRFKEKKNNFSEVEKEKCVCVCTCTYVQWQVALCEVIR